MYFLVLSFKLRDANQTRGYTITIIITLDIFQTNPSPGTKPQKVYIRKKKPHRVKDHDNDYKQRGQTLSRGFTGELPNTLIVSPSSILLVSAL